MKINSKVHAMIDYLIVLFLWLSPTLFTLPSLTSAIVYGIGAIHLALSICTHYELGLVKFIRLKIHGAIELSVSLFLVPIAFYLGSLEGEIARNYLLAFAIALFIVRLLSDYTNKSEGNGEIPVVESNTDGGMI